MNETELRLRKIAERIEQLRPENLAGKEHLVTELDETIKELGSLYDSEGNKL